MVNRTFRNTGDAMVAEGSDYISLSFVLGFLYRVSKATLHSGPGSPSLVDF